MGFSLRKSTIGKFRTDCDDAGNTCWKHPHWHFVRQVKTFQRNTALKNRTRNSGYRWEVTLDAEAWGKCFFDNPRSVITITLTLNKLGSSFFHLLSIKDSAYTFTYNYYPLLARDCTYTSWWFLFKDMHEQSKCQSWHEKKIIHNYKFWVYLKLLNFYATFVITISDYKHLSVSFPLLQFMDRKICNYFFNVLLQRFLTTKGIEGFNYQLICGYRWLLILHKNTL